MQKITLQDYPIKAKEYIETRQDFEICGVEIGMMYDLCAELESDIENRQLKCRIYTKNRLATGLSAVLNPRWGILALATIVVHNLFTYNPDVEIYRDIANKRVGVVWKRL